VGQPHRGGMGAVVVNPVARIPLPPASLPQIGGQPDRIAGAHPPPKPHSKARVVEPEPDAIPIQGRNALKHTLESSTPNKFRAQQQDRPTSSIATPASA